MAIQIKSSEQTLMSDINVTPLVDVMSVLLIIFIVTAPLHAVNVKLPNTVATTAAKTKKHIHLSVNRDGKLYLDEQPIDEAALAERLKALHAQYPEMTVQLLGNEGVPYGQIAKVMGMVNRVGISKLSLVMRATRNL